jgi:antitoxin component of RelBE/YafQ-DinJ toxin-antitoxin module
MYEQNKDTVISVRAKSALKNEYKKMCESLGYTYSKRIISLIEKDIECLKIALNKSHEV